eukprot:jgi/Bigna1/138598/aug1.45_g13306
MYDPELPRVECVRKGGRRGEGGLGWAIGYEHNWPTSAGAPTDQGPVFCISLQDISKVATGDLGLEKGEKAGPPGAGGLVPEKDPAERYKHSD